MDQELLERELYEHTGGRTDLSNVLSAYLAEVRRAAALLDVELTDSRVSSESGRIELTIIEAPELVIRWTPAQGWLFEYEEGGQQRWKYRMGSETDVASIVVEAENVAAWLRVLADGDRDGHVDEPEELDPSDAALLDRLTTIGAGRDPYSPYE